MLAGFPPNDRSPKNFWRSRVDCDDLGLLFSNDRANSNSEGAQGSVARPLRGDDGGAAIGLERPPTAPRISRKMSSMCFVSQQTMCSVGRGDLSKISSNVNSVLYGLADGAGKPQSGVAVQCILSHVGGVTGSVCLCGVGSC